MADWNLDYDYIASLVERAKMKDSDAFAELYLATYKKVFRFAWQYLKNEQQAQDAMQETYIIVFKKLYTLKDPQLFVSWLNQIVFRVCFSMQKKDNVFNQMNLISAEGGELVADSRQQPENIAVMVDQRQYIIKQIMALPFTEAQVIVLYYYNRMKQEDIAELLGISRSTVKRSLESGKNKLAKMVER